MEAIKPQYTWITCERGLSSTSQTKHGQAVALDRVQKTTGPIYNRRKDPVIYVRKKIFCSTPRYAELAEREYKILRDMKHKHILIYADFECDGEIAYLYTKYCDSGDLGHFLRGKSKAGQFTAAYAWDVARQISSALVYIHYGVTALTGDDGKYNELELTERVNDAHDNVYYLHRDIKPENIFISKIDHDHIVVQLGDFGLAKEFVEDTSYTYVGTMEYIAPECRPAAGKCLVSRKMDIWAFGKTLQKLMLDFSDRIYHLDRVVSDCCNEDVNKRFSSLEVFDSLARREQEPLLLAAIRKDWPPRELNFPDVIFIEHLIKNGGPVNGRGFYGETALHLVSWEGKFHRQDMEVIAKLLKDKGADSNAKDAFNLTPEHWRAYSRCGVLEHVQETLRSTLLHPPQIRELVSSSTSLQECMPLFLTIAYGDEVALSALQCQISGPSLMKLRMSCALGAKYGQRRCLEKLRHHRLYAEQHFPSTRKSRAFADKFCSAVIEILLVQDNNSEDVKLNAFYVFPGLWLTGGKARVTIELILDLLVVVSGNGDTPVTHLECGTAEQVPAKAIYGDMMDLLLAASEKDLHDKFMAWSAKRGDQVEAEMKRQVRFRLSHDDVDGKIMGKAALEAILGRDPLAFYMQHEADLVDRLVAMQNRKLHN